MDGKKQAQAWKDWLASNNGQSCTNGSATGEYLENRLRCAFMSGVEAAENEPASALPQKESE